MEADFHVINHFTGTAPDSHHTITQLLVKFLMRKKEDGSGDQEIYGKRMLVNAIVKENLGGKTKIVSECKTEADRIRALKEWFGITLTDEEIGAIKGTATELI